ncbi:helix-turn-helix domain-containing protein [Aromatoleum toluclasticum]
MSKWVSRVEARLGVRLPQRSRRRQSLTELGGGLCGLVDEIVS